MVRPGAEAQVSYRLTAAFQKGLHRRVRVQKRENQGPAGQSSSGDIGETATTDRLFRKTCSALCGDFWEQGVVFQIHSAAAWRLGFHKIPLRKAT